MNSTSVYAVILILIILKIKPSNTQSFKSSTNNEYYIDIEQEYSWTEAFIACIEMNMTLVTIESRPKSHEITAIVQNNFGKVKLWIGGIMSRFPHRHIWVATGEPFSYENWFASHAIYRDEVQYCVYTGKGRNLEWNDSVCTHQHGFICEKNRDQLRFLQLQIELDNEKMKQQKLLQQLQRNNEKEQLLEKEIQDKQTQQVSLKQELVKVKERAEQEIRDHQKLQQHLKAEIDKQQQISKQDLKKLEMLEKHLQNALEKQRNLQHDLHEQQNSKHLLEEQLNKLKEKPQTPTRDLILHFHQN